MRLRPLERITTQTLLGIRFWDRLINRPIAEGLLVTAQRLSDDRSQRLGRVVTGRSTPSGVIAFFGLAAEERVRDDANDQLWETAPLPQLVVVDVWDPLGRYLPLSFVAQLPFKGPFRGQGAWLETPLVRPLPIEDEAPLGVYLWSAPSRPVPPARAVIRGQLVVGDGNSPAPAAYALVSVTQPSESTSPQAAFQIFGLADERGELALPLPYPPLPEPPDGTYPPLYQQQFELILTVYYQPEHQTRLPGSRVPNLERILTQGQAHIGYRWSADTTPVLRTDATTTVYLGFEQPLILRTELSRPGEEPGHEVPAGSEPFLRIQPIES